MAVTPVARCTRRDSELHPRLAFLDLSFDQSFAKIPVEMVDWRFAAALPDPAGAVPTPLFVDCLSDVVDVVLP